MPRALRRYQGSIHFNRFFQIPCDESGDPERRYRPDPAQNDACHDIAEIRMFAKGRLPSRHNIYSDFPLTTAQPEKWGQSVLRSTGEINNGGDPIVLITSAGDISLKAE